MELIGRLSLPGLALIIVGFAFLIWFLPYKRDDEEPAETQESHD